MKVCTVEMCAISTSWWLSPSSSRNLLDRGAHTYYPQAPGDKLPGPGGLCLLPLVAGETTNHCL